MHYTTLGRTGLKVSVAGLGCGGFSRLGLGTGGSEDAAIAIVRQAIELGVNLFDTAAAYGTEAVLGKAIKIGAARQRRHLHQGAVSLVERPGDPATGSSPASTICCASSTPTISTSTSCTASRRRITPTRSNELAPVLLRERDKGKFRFLGITETAPHDLDARDAAPRRAGRRVGCRAWSGFR